MKRYELTLTPTYVQNWELLDAFRELIQNGLDAQTADADNKFKTEYNEATSILQFINPKSVLDVQTLLLGKSSKSDDANTIGQFGEGYKVASLVLLRLGKTFRILNYNANQIWTAVFTNSETWGTEVLTYEVEDIENTEGKTGLIFEVGNISWRENDDLWDVWLNAGDFYDEYNLTDEKYDAVAEPDIIHTTYGDILLMEECQGLVYINQLAIKFKGKELEYGYNFKPQYIKVERDRQTCSDWDIKYYTTRMVAEALAEGKISSSRVESLVQSSSEDIRNLDWAGGDSKVATALIIEKFTTNHPDMAHVPCYRTEDIQKVKALGGKVIVVQEFVGKVLQPETNRRIEYLKNTYDESTLTLKQRFENWYSMYAYELKTESSEAFKKLVNELEGEVE